MDDKAQATDAPGADGPTDRRRGTDRRRFVAGTALATLGASTLLLSRNGAVGAATAAASSGVPDVTRLARFLTAKPDLSPEFVERAVSALIADEPAMGERLRALDAAIGAARLADVEAFRASALAADPAMMGPALSLIAALYLGSTGIDRPSRNVSLEEALMYRPTGDKTPTPTYARGGPGWWNRSEPA
ncbi:hypothetical protein H7F51_07880 [Novosphingobium flavum]|uniref:Membrane bound FAD containing D-sorbitol dehydrogenase n=1 Tax=Novosphingobium flavum TaxID=1778672 RepID=A0A7X1FSB0_9SPHN|nr:sugar dehydrogenase complex small subunit [Novosphingobium flavum]MBC2665437.1 hypothetical protein [Novosphingobium flavum]